jgi:hypothetical protein
MQGMLGRATSNIDEIAAHLGIEVGGGLEDKTAAILKHLTSS